jgi:aromatic ring-opening dioxygenase LigB subunit
MSIIFTCISPHPPILLPFVGAPKDRAQVKRTIESLEGLAKKLKKEKPDTIIISSPHPDWGFNVPLHFLANHFQGKIKKILIGLEGPQFYFEKGKQFYSEYYLQDYKDRFALIASGDLSHCLKKDGPYGFNSDGPNFDNELVESLKKKNINKILELDNLYPQAGQCGLSSICFILGVLEVSDKDYQPEILSYEHPFGVGYLTVDFKMTNN